MILSFNCSSANIAKIQQKAAKIIILIKSIMNKKLFFAGFALLAAVSFTSCNSDNPIDVTDPNGVRPVNSTHYVGGSYDWTATVKDYDDLKEFWAKDAK
jgi:hypothetical protein